MHTCTTHPRSSSVRSGERVRGLHLVLARAAQGRLGLLAHVHQGVDDPAARGGVRRGDRLARVKAATDIESWIRTA